MMRAEVMRKFPELARYLQPKCGEHRLGYCDEALADWEKCPIGKSRPHKTRLFQGYELFLKQATVAQKRRRSGGSSSTEGQMGFFDVSDFENEKDAEQANQLAEHFTEVSPLTEDDFLIIESEESST
jgi:hypothetical protein